MNFSCFILGEGPLASLCLELLLEQGHSVKGVISADADLCSIARQSGVPVHSGAEDLALTLTDHGFDYLFSIVWRQLLPSSILSMPRRLAINYHDSPLPRYAGTHATTWALMQLEKQHGVTWHVMAEQVDAGDILQQKTIAIDADETTQSLDLKCLEAGYTAFAELVNELKSGTETRIPQNPDNRTYYPSNRLPVNGAVLDWRKPAHELDALCRSLDYGSNRENDLSLPKIIVGEEVLIVKSADIQKMNATVPGRIHSLDSVSIAVETGQDVLKIEVCSTIDGEPVQVNEFVARHSLKVGALLPDVPGTTGNRVNEIQEGLVTGERFWRQRFSSLAPFELPYPVKRVSSSGKRCWERMIFEESESTQPVAAVFGTNRDAPDVLAAAFIVFLSRLSRRYRFHVWFGNKRLIEALQGLTYLYATSIPLEIDANADTRCCDMMDAVFSEIDQTERQGTCARDIFARYPEYRWMTQSMGIEVATAEVPDLTVVPSSVYFRFVTNSNGTGFSLFYDAAVLEQSVAQEIGTGFTAFLVRMVSAPKEAVRKIPLLTEEQRHCVITEWNATRDSSVPDACVHQLIEAQASSGPDRIAAVFCNRKLTYRALNRKANALALTLAKEGVSRGCFLPVIMHSGFNLLVTYLAAMKVGAAFVPLDPLWPVNRIKQVLDSLESAAVVLESDGIDTSVLLEAGCTSTFIPVDHHSLVDEDANPDSVSDPGDPAYMIFTSGSTGEPKGVINTHRGAVNRFYGSSRDYQKLGLELKEIVVLNTSSPVFDPSIRQLLWPLTVGGRTVIPLQGERPNLDCLLELVAEEQVTAMSLVSPLFTVLTEQLEGQLASRTKLDTLEYFLVGGAHVDINTVNRFKKLCPGVAIRNIYGPSEAAMGVISFAADSVKHAVLPIGKPLPNVTAFILDDDLEPMPVGAIGEICIGGPQVGLGYLNDPAATDAVFVRNPFAMVDGEKLYRTGDFGYFLADGNIVFTGRKDDQVKIHGVRVELDEIRCTLDAHPGVRESVVITSNETGIGTRLMAYIVPGDESVSLVKELTEYLGLMLPAACIPGSFTLLEGLPRLSSGKIDRHRLPEPDSPQGSSAEYEAPPRTPAEAAVALILQEVLGVEPFNQEVNIFDLGADSLSIMRFINRVRQKFGVEFSFQDAFKYSTVAAAASRIETLYSNR